MRRSPSIATGASALAVTILAIAGCGATPHSAAPSAAVVQRAFAGSPAPLAALHAQAGKLSATSAAAFRGRLAALRGYPVVINKWASWCGPCRQEFPAFQSAGVAFGRQVAFLGLDSFDNGANARTFLRQFPVTYPSIFDPSASQAQALGGGQGWPTTIFFNAAHTITNVHVGAYPSRQALEQDIAHYT